MADYPDEALQAGTPTFFVNGVRHNGSYDPESLLEDDSHDRLGRAHDPGRFRAVLLGLSTGNAVGLAVVAGIFVVFALASALLIPRRWPDFPGENLRWFIVATLVLLVGTLAAVEVFAKEPEEATAGETADRPGMTIPTTTQPQPPPPTQAGDPAAGKGLFVSEGCGGCHAFSAAGSTGTVGPDLDEALKGKDASFIRESIVDPNKEITQGYAPNVMPEGFGQKLTPKQLEDLMAFLEEG